MNLSPAQMLDLEDQPEQGNALRLFGAVVSGISVSAVFVPVALLLWFTAMGRPGHHVATPEAIVAEIKAAGKAGERTEAQLLAVAKGTQKTRLFASRFFFKPLEILLVSSAALLAAYFAALYVKADDVHDGKGEGSLLGPTLAGTAAGAAALWGLWFLLSAMPAAGHDAHGHGKHDSHGAGHGAVEAAKPKSLSDFLADNAALMDIVVYLGGTAAAGLVAAVTPRGKPSAGADSHGHEAHGHAAH